MSKALVLLIVVAQALSAASRLALAATGKVSGTVSVAGAYQRPKPLPVFKNRSFCGTAVPNETLLIGAGGGLRNAVVLLRPLDGKVPTQPGTVVLDNKHCAFTPHVQVATVGSELLLKNSDPILHTVHARMGRETLFNVGLPKWRRVNKRLDRPGVVRIDCDVLHTWMSAAVVVADTPYFAVTDERGRFALDGLPLGAYETEVWHERLGTRRRQLQLNGSSAIASIEVIYSLENRR
jgi:plastocyanin